MALRFYYPSNELTTFPAGQVFAIAEQQVGDVYVELGSGAELVVDSLIAVEIEAGQVVVPQDLATEMNQARLAVQALLLENHRATRLLIEQLRNAGGAEAVLAIWEVLAVMRGKPVQKNNSVQVNAELTALIDAINDQYILPIDLIQIASQFLQEAKGGADKKNADLDAVYRQKLRDGCSRLVRLRQQMIVSNTGLVSFIANRYRNSSISFEDLQQEGMVGLIKAVDRFDAERGIRFSTYAVFWIKQAISRLIIKQEKVVRLPVALAERAWVVFDLMRSCYLENNRWPTEAEIQSQCSLSAEEIRTISNYYQDTHSLDAGLSEDNPEQTLMDTLSQQQFVQPLNELISNNLNLFVTQVVATLTEKEAAILNMRFGLKNHSAMTLQAIADHLHVTRERVRQIQNQALYKLKQQFGYELLPFLEANDN
jgi:RNA polymerase primary sigma factor